MQKKDVRATVRQFTPRATLAALGIKLRSMKLLAPVQHTVVIPQKTIKHQPINKLMDAFIAILSGAHGLVEVNTRVRGDVALQRAFGRSSCADQSLVQTTLNACTLETVRQMEQSLATIFRDRSRAFRHQYEEELQLLDVDMTGLPCGKRAEGSKKGYFSNVGIRYGRQMGRVVATHYDEIVTDQLYPGNVQLNRALRPLVTAAEEVLGLDYAKRQRTILRIDAGGGSLDDANWCLDRGYQIHCKDVSSQRAEAWAATVKQWYVDSKKPERQVGWAVPEATPDYVRPVRRLVIRWQDRRGRISHAMLISTLSARDVIRLLGQPVSNVNDPRLVALAYAKFYDQRGGAVEIDIKQSKQGLGLRRRSKKKFEAQRMVILLSSLAHNVLVWMRGWLSHVSPKLTGFGLLRLVRDVLSVCGFVELTGAGVITRIVLNGNSGLARGCVRVFRRLLHPQHIGVRLGSIQWRAGPLPSIVAFSALGASGSGHSVVPVP